eukprot:6136792-Alexandrium_andersonii.AAC.1
MITYLSPGSAKTFDSASSCLNIANSAMAPRTARARGRWRAAATAATAKPKRAHGWRQQRRKQVQSGLTAQQFGTSRPDLLNM